jgi:hypothetical protein
MSTDQSNGKTSVLVAYAPFPSEYPPVGACQITIYTATGPRHPVTALVEQKNMTGGWDDKGTHLVNNYPIGMVGSLFGEILRFTFDCPAPQQYWEIHIETLPMNPLPSYLDSMIGSCEPREFAIAYPGVITRVTPHALSEEDVFANYVSKSATVVSAMA